MPTTTTTLPSTTTTAPPQASTTASPAGTTTAAPNGSTTAAPGGSTTAAPGGSTTAAPGGSTTAAPGGSTTAAPGGSTTAAPGGSTTAAPGTTTTAAPGSTTTSGGGTGDGVAVTGSIAIDPPDPNQDGASSLQVAESAKLTLSWSSSGASSVDIDPLGTGMGTGGSQAIPTSEATYKLTAVASDGSRSPEVALEVHTHPDGEVVSGHATVDSGAGSGAGSGDPEILELTGDVTDAQGNDFPLASAPGSYKTKAVQQQLLANKQNTFAPDQNIVLKWKIGGDLTGHTVRLLTAVASDDTTAVDDTILTTGTSTDATQATQTGGGSAGATFKHSTKKAPSFLCDLQILDASNNVVKTQTICGFGTYSLGQVKSFSVTAPDGSSSLAADVTQLHLQAQTQMGAAASLWVVALDGATVIETFKIKEHNGAEAIDTTHDIDRTKYLPGHSITFKAGLLGLNPDSGDSKTNADPWKIPGEGTLIDGNSSATMGSAPPAPTPTTTTAPAPPPTTTDGSGGGTGDPANEFIISVTMGTAILKPLVLADDKLKTSKLVFTYRITTDTPAGAPPQPASVALQLTNKSGAVLKSETFTDANLISLNTDHPWEWDGYDASGVLDTAMIKQGVTVQCTVKAAKGGESSKTTDFSGSAPSGAVGFCDVKIDSNGHTVAIAVRYYTQRIPLPVGQTVATAAQEAAAEAGIESGIPLRWARPITLDSVSFAVSAAVTQTTSSSIKVLVIPQLPSVGSVSPRSCNVGIFFPGVTGDVVIFMVDNAPGPVDMQYTGAHEIGHSILGYAKGSDFSATHKGTSTIAGDMTSAAVVYPTSGDIDLMKYYHSPAPADTASREKLTVDDLKALISLTMVQLG